MAVPHPIPYQGSKRKLAKHILQEFSAIDGRLIEPFAGSAAIALAARADHHAEALWLNDINAPLMSLWAEIVHHPHKLADYYEKLWHAQNGQERIFYDRVRDRFNKTYRSHYFLYLLARCVKASVRYNAQGEFNQSPDNRRKGRKSETMRRDILEASRLLQGDVRLTAVDYRAVLACATPDDLVYLDPPYQGTSQGRDPRYAQGIAYEKFVAALADLNKRHVPFILSYDGRTGTKTFGEHLPQSLKLHCLELAAGRSSQATLLGKSAQTYESLYLSPALVTKKPMVILETPETAVINPPTPAQSCRVLHPLIKSRPELHRPRPAMPRLVFC